MLFRSSLVRVMEGVLLFWVGPMLIGYIAVSYTHLDVYKRQQMQKLQEVLAKRLSENTVYDYLQTTNMDLSLIHICALSMWRACLNDIRRKQRSNSHDGSNDYTDRGTTEYHGRDASGDTGKGRCV